MLHNSPLVYQIDSTITIAMKSTPWTESASELYGPSDRRLSAKLVPTFVDRGCHVVSAKDAYGRILGSLDRSRYFFFQVAPELYSRGRVDPVPDPLLLTETAIIRWVIFLVWSHVCAGVPLGDGPLSLC
jgi:hypothetical protein